MIFSPIEIQKNYKYKGIATDKNNKVRYYFYTNSDKQFNELKDGKDCFGFKFVSGKRNPNYEVLKKLDS